MADKKGSAPSQKSKKISNVSSLFSFMVSSDDFVSHHAARYMLNFLNQAKPGDPGAFTLISAIEINYNGLEGFPFEGTPDKEDEKRRTLKYNDTRGQQRKVDPKDWENLKGFFSDIIDKTQDKADHTPPLLQSFYRLLDQLGFDESTQDIARMLYVNNNHYHFRVFAAYICEDPSMAGIMASFMLGVPEKADEIKKLIGPNGTLSQFGLIDTHSRVKDESVALPIIDRKLVARIEGVDDDQDLLDRVVGKHLTTNLDLGDFEAIADQLDPIIREIKYAVENDEKGFNVLLIGQEGVGKTELAKVIARELGKRLIAIGESDTPDESIEFDYDGEMLHREERQDGETCRERLRQLRRGQKVFAGKKDVILFLDEAEDLVPKGEDASKTSDPHNKLATNRLLETNDVVTIMAVNDIDKFHRSFVDRYKRKLFVDNQPTLARKKMWKKQAKRLGVKLSDHETTYLARSYKASPRKIIISLESAKRLDGTLQNIEDNLATNALVKSSVKTHTPIDRYFDTDLFNLTRHDPLKGNANNESTGTTSQDNISRLITMGQEKYPYSLFLEVGGDMDEQSLITFIAENCRMNIDVHDVLDLAADDPRNPPSEKIENAFTNASNLNRFLLLRGIEGLSEAPLSSSDWSDAPLVKLFMNNVLDHDKPVIITADRKASEEMPDTARALFSEQMKMHDIDPANVPGIYKRYFRSRAPKSVPTEKLRPVDFKTARRLLDRWPETSSPTRISEVLKSQRDKRIDGDNSGGMGFKAPEA